MTRTSPWFIPAYAPHRRLRLYCFPYAGGSAACYSAWQSKLGPWIEVCAVQLPGRGARFLEPPESALEPLVDRLVQALAGQDKLPFAFFGHSMGALLAFETARCLQRQGLAPPATLLVSGCAAPRLRDPPRALPALDDGALMAALKDYNGTPPEILAHRELMELLLPAIRADFALVDSYVYRPGPLLEIPLSVLAGRRDVHLSALQAAAWRQESSHGCQLQWFEDGHFFINSEQQAVTEFVRTALSGVGQSP